MESQRCLGLLGLCLQRGLLGMGLVGTRMRTMGMMGMGMMRMRIRMMGKGMVGMMGMTWLMGLMGMLKLCCHSI